MSDNTCADCRFFAPEPDDGSYGACLCSFAMRKDQSLGMTMAVYSASKPGMKACPEFENEGGAAMTMGTATTEPKPCPNCSGRPYVAVDRAPFWAVRHRTSVRVECGCGLRGPRVPCGPGWKASIEARRKAVEKWDRMSERRDGRW